MVGVTNEHLSTEVFRKILQDLHPLDSSLENVFLIAEWGKHKISLYALPEDNYTLIIEDFGYESKGFWYQITPTKAQLEILEKALETELNQLYKIDREAFIYEESEDVHNQDINETFNHININFYTSY
ncbi:hypothetical protein NBRC110019_20390 [Neptunitalea chrysea]|uniref:Uncharacterized protein n=1 Tax=Neptunitalea chrysea TaxID=1647581 RepID=A0A9W6EUT9_9FLAO|nr:hypothetical protein [Neptunitalea chrysea]GLB52999.1 hypothetical protein NBRC110019_20390 [Neptunitalea chrysea]